MGIYDRAYYRGDERGAWMGNRSMVINLILVNAAVYLAQVLLGGDRGQNELTSALSLHANFFQEPWRVWQLLTYGFLHDPHSILHILFNMYFLYVFGNDLEQIYGRMEFLRFYLATIVVAGLAWAGVEAAQGGQGPSLVGASGGIMGLMILFVLHFPRRMFLFMFFIPMPAWVLGGLFVLADLAGIADRGDHVSHVAHLSGVAFGLIYHQAGWNLGRALPRRLSLGRFRLRPRLRIHDPQEASRDLTDRVDAILQKISQHGEASLTKKERRTLEEASRRYQRRRQ